MEPKYRYKGSLQRVAKILLYTSNGKVEEHVNAHCCEVVKNTINTVDKVELYKEYVAYTEDEIKRWTLLIQNHGANFEYTIKDGYHIITLYNRKFKSVEHQYLSLLLARYLWYNENDGLIDRIFDMVDKGISFTYALKMANYYDNVSRDNTFNLNFTNHFFLANNVNLFDNGFYTNCSINNQFSSQLFHHSIDNSYPTLRCNIISTVSKILFNYIHEYGKTNDYNSVLNKWQSMCYNYAHWYCMIDYNDHRDYIRNYLMKILKPILGFKDLEIAKEIEIGATYIYIGGVLEKVIKRHEVLDNYYITDKGGFRQDKLNSLYKVII